MSSSALVSQFDSIAFPLSGGVSSSGGANRRPVARQAAAVRPVATTAPVAPADRQVAAGQSSGAVAVAPVAVCMPVDRAVAAGELAAAVSMGGTQAFRSIAGTVSFRQKCVDVVLLGMWAALIPGFMWLGHYAGF
ncbi:hypothetical protein NJI34_16390 [Pseudomonas sp. S 311-6]|uniref:Uncharacterized protein n=1 Tax=Kerstersia gyiorum TaxID=206506 RepID=A0A171KVG9_9BURK|nr:hypothetical protein [Kerstersia gyiorum]KKO72886.1 hypothetical protein AAV32_00615 [Kerstersia gyiorum]MCO7638357.1 hypothetical protein [Pseudomonas sp. S 311-6]